MGRSCQTALHATEKTFMKSQLMLQTSLFSYFKKLSKKQQQQQNKIKEEISTATPLFTNHPSDQSAAINTEARPSSSKKIIIC